MIGRDPYQEPEPSAATRVLLRLALQVPQGPDVAVGSRRPLGTSRRARPLKRALQQLWVFRLSVRGFDREAKL